MLHPIRQPFVSAIYLKRFPPYHIAADIWSEDALTMQSVKELLSLDSLPELPDEYLIGVDKLRRFKPRICHG